MTIIFVCPLVTSPEQQGNFHSNHERSHKMPIQDTKIHVSVNKTRKKQSVSVVLEQKVQRLRLWKMLVQEYLKK